MSKDPKIPDATIERISLYSRPLELLLSGGTMVVSSERLAELCEVNPAQVRKDLSYFGEFGVRGIGYGVRDLLVEIKKILVSDREWRMAIVGLGNMGMALVQHENFNKRGYRFVVAFDPDPGKVGSELPNGLVIRALKELPFLIEELEVEVGVIATQPGQAQTVAEILIAAGIKAILNCSPIQIRQQESCLVENVDFTVNLDNLAYHLGKKD
jgi:redox-sensing transcriptional repressor